MRRTISSGQCCSRSSPERSSQASDMGAQLLVAWRALPSSPSWNQALPSQELAGDAIPGSAGVSGRTAGDLGLAGGRGFLVLAGGSDCVVSAW